MQLDDPNTSQAAELFGERLGELGVKTVYDETYAPDTSNFDTIANSIKQADPDLVINGAIAGDGIALGPVVPEGRVLARDALPAERPDRPGVPGRDRRRQHRGDLHATSRGARRPTFPTQRGVRRGLHRAVRCRRRAEDAANSYTAGQVLAAAVEEVGELDQTAIAEWLHANTVDTIVGPLSWDETGRPQGDMLLAQFQDGALSRSSAPSRAATTDDVAAGQAGLARREGDRDAAPPDASSSGLLVGGVYALMSSGFSLVFGVMKIINLSHGAMIVLAAFLTWWVWDRTGVDPLLVGVLVTPVMYVVGWLLYKAVIARVHRIDHELAMVASFGVAVAAGGVMSLIWGTEVRSATPSYFNRPSRSARSPYRRPSCTPSPAPW